MTHSLRIVACLALACLIAPVAPASEAVRVSGNGVGMSVLRRLVAAYPRDREAPRVQLVLPAMGSGGGIRALLRGALDLAVSARPLRAREEGQGLSAVELGRTPFVIATASGTGDPEGWSLARIEDLYAGRLTRWPDGRRVRLVLRPATDSDISVLRGMSPGMSQAVDRALARRGVPQARTDQIAARLIEKIPGAVGCTTLAMIRADRRALTPVPIEGARPTLADLASGRYPYYKPLYLVLPVRPRPAVERLVVRLRAAASREALAGLGVLATGDAP